MVSPTAPNEGVESPEQQFRPRCWQAPLIAYTHRYEFGYHARTRGCFNTLREARGAHEVRLISGANSPPSLLESFKAFGRNVSFVVPHSGGWKTLKRT